MIGYTPLPSGQSGGITGTLGVNAWSAGVVPFDPMDAPEVGEWWDIRTLAGTPDSDPVGSMVGNKGLYTLTASGAARPMYALDEGDGYPAILNDGVDDTVGCVITNAALFGSTGDMEVWMVLRMPLVPTGGVFFSTGATNQIGFQGGASNGQAYLCHGSVAINYPTAAMADNAWHVIRLKKVGARRVVEIDGVAVYDATTTAGPYGTGIDGLNIGQCFGLYSQVRWRHFLTCTAPLSDQAALDMEFYLRNAK